MGYSPWGHKELDMTEHACTNIAAQRLDKGPVLGIKLPPETFARIWAGCGGENVAMGLASVSPGQITSENRLQGESNGGVSASC